MQDSSDLQYDVLTGRRTDDNQHSKVTPLGSGTRHGLDSLTITCFFIVPLDSFVRVILGLYWIQQVLLRGYRGIGGNDDGCEDPGS